MVEKTKTKALQGHVPCLAIRRIQAEGGNPKELRTAYWATPVELDCASGRMAVYHSTMAAILAAQA